MAQHVTIKTTFEPTQVIEPIYTGGDVALSDDGTILVTCLAEDVLLSDPSSGQKLARITGDGEVATTIALTPSASHIIICSRSLSMRIYTLEQPTQGTLRLRLQRTLKPHTSPVVTSTTDRTGTLLATGGADGIVKVWDIRGGFTTHTFHGHAGVVSALHFFEVDPSTEAEERGNKKKKRRKSEQAEDVGNETGATGAGYRLASGSEDGKIRIWNLQKRTSIATLDEHVSVVRSLDFDEIEHALVSGSRDKTIIFWDAATWKQRNTIPILEGVEACAFLAQSNRVYTGGESGRLRLWNSTSGVEITREQSPAPEGQSILQLVYHRSLPYVLSIHGDQTILFHSLHNITKTESGTTHDPLPIFRRISGNHDEVIDMAYVGGKQDLLAIATNTEEVRLLSIKGDDPTETSTAGHDSTSAAYFGADVGLLQGHEDIIICMDVDWSGHWLATGAKDNTARLWRIDPPKDSYTCVATFTGHAESLGAIALPRTTPPEGSAAHKSPLDHPPLFLLTGSQDKTIKRWEISPSSSSKTQSKQPRAVYTRKAHDKDINALDTNYSSTLFASASQDRTVKLWSLEDGEAVGVLRGHRRGVWSVKFAPKDAPSITGEGGSQVSSARGLILTGSGDKTVKIWSLADYSCLRTFEGHTNSVLKVLWMPPVPPISSTNLPQDEYMDLDTDEIPAPQPSGPHKIQTTQVASAGSDGLVKVWDIQSSELACTLDNHTDRVWALIAGSCSAASSPTRTLISGAADSLITLWTDTTSTTTSLALTQSTARVTQDQDLQNHIRARNYHAAITLALTLNHPGRLLALFTEVCNAWPRDEGSLTGRKQVDEVLKGLSDRELWLLLERCREWNVSARTAPVAQRVLGALLKLLPATRFTNLRPRSVDPEAAGTASPSKGLQQQGNVKDLLDALRVYTERHYRRLEELIDESYLVEYTLNEMDEVAGFGANGDLAIDGVTINGNQSGEEHDEDIMLLD